MKEFMDWIEQEINPMREKKGLAPILPDEQVRCYEILQAFHAKWDKASHEEGKNVKS